MRYPWRGLSVRNRPVLGPPRSLPTAIIPLLLAAAVLGYVAGHSHSASTTSESARTAKGAHVLVEYPPRWRPVSVGAHIPGLAIAHAQLIAPGGDAARAGLIVGSLPAGELGPLPRAFVSRLRALPQTAVVDLVESQAYRYVQFSGPGLREPLTVFVLPNSGGESTALACYAPSRTSLYLRECEGAVSGVTVVDQSQIYQLNPEPGYGARISAAIAPLDSLRVSLKRELKAQVTAARAQQLATQLGGAFSKAAASLSGLEPSPAAAGVQAALASSMQRTSAGYRALAAAAGERSARAYAIAQKRISLAEADVDWALENFVLIGYSPALQNAASSP
jgi:hypothetical protein